MSNVDSLPVCRWRREQVKPGFHVCMSPKLLVHEDGIADSFCFDCPYQNHPVEIAPNFTGSTEQVPLPVCVHLGKAVTDGRPDNVRDWRHCDRGHGHVCPCDQCRFCPETQTIEQVRHFRVPLGDIADPKTRAFNPSIVVRNGRLLMGYRVGWGGGSIRIAELDRNCNVTHDTPITLIHPHCSFGQEDPRLFEWNGRLCLSFCGTEVFTGTLGVHQLLAVLTDDFRVERVWYPKYDLRQRCEKNWVYFDHEGELYCVYHSVPEHQILRIGDRATLAYSIPTGSIWQGGLVRGGASPVHHRGQYYHWFHGWRQLGSKIMYSMGLACFEDHPPFRIRRMTPLPLLGPNLKEDPGFPISHTKSVVFPGGALIRNGEWWVSYGHHDCRCEIAIFDEDEVERQLHRV